MNCVQAIALLNRKADADHLKGMSRYGIDTAHALGVKVPEIRALAKQINKDHQLALELWESGIHEARLLATLIDDPKAVTREQMDDWTNTFYSWDICDQACGNLFDRTTFAIEKAIEYAGSEKEYVKRAGFVLMAGYGMHNKKAPDELLINFFPLIEQQAWDDRNFVKKALNWALRQIGKRNENLNRLAIESAGRILLQHTKAARWIASDALRELKKHSAKY